MRRHTLKLVIKTSKQELSYLTRCLLQKHQQKLNADDTHEIHLTTQANNKKSRVQVQDNLINLDAKQSFYELPDASILDNSWRQLKFDFKTLPSVYVKLSKRNLTALVVSTAVCGYVMGPASFVVSKFLFTILGTTLTSTAANTYNQFLEVPYDSQMNRTKDRVLVRGILSPLHAFTFGTVCTGLGISILYYCVNPLTASLALANIFLYAGVYTPLKRLSALNTWFGSIVGAIPPIMGYTACTGQIDSAGILLGAILYSWQFPHFHALSWNLRGDYSRAGYRMISVLNPRVCTSSSLNHTLFLTAMCSILAPMCYLTTWNFAIDSLPFNLYFIYLALRFKRDEDANSSRKLFRYSLVYLPMIIMLMFITKYSNDINDDDKSYENKKFLMDNVKYL